MAHGTRINGVNKAVTAGFTRINGVNKKVKKGLTLVGGVQKDINFGGGLFTVTITGSGMAGFGGYATIKGTTYSSPAVLEVESGEQIYVAAGTVYFNGMQVSPQYTFTLESNVTISLGVARTDITTS